MGLRGGGGSILDMETFFVRGWKRALSLGKVGGLGLGGSGCMLWNLDTPILSLCGLMQLCEERAGVLGLW